MDDYFSVGLYHGFITDSRSANTKKNKLKMYYNRNFLNSPSRIFLWRVLRSFSFLNTGFTIYSMEGYFYDKQLSARS